MEYDFFGNLKIKSEKQIFYFCFFEPEWLSGKVSKIINVKTNSADSINDAAPTITAIN
jgi:hypothetical protein